MSAFPRQGAAGTDAVEDFSGMSAGELFAYWSTASRVPVSERRKPTVTGVILSAGVAVPAVETHRCFSGSSSASRVTLATREFANRVNHNHEDVP
jgi:hypothetical protein